MYEIFYATLYKKHFVRVWKFQGLMRVLKLGEYGKFFMRVWSFHGLCEYGIGKSMRVWNLVMRVSVRNFMRVWNGSFHASMKLPASMELSQGLASFRACEFQGMRVSTSCEYACEFGFKFPASFLLLATLELQPGLASFEHNSDHASFVSHLRQGCHS